MLQVQREYRVKAFQIISDGSCDLSQSLISENEIDIVPFSITFDSDKETALLQNVDITNDAFYRHLADSPKDFPYSACPSMHSYLDHFEKAYYSRTPILCVCISSKWSGSYSSACIAKDFFIEKHPDAKIEVIDSDSNTVVQALYILEIARLRDKGVSFEEVVRLSRSDHEGRIYFTVNDLSFLEHGGRIGNLASLLAKIFPLNPIIAVRNGEIFNGGIALKRKRALTLVIERVKEQFAKAKAKWEDFIFTIGYCYDRLEAEGLQRLFEVATGIKALLLQIGMTIATHTGPTALGIGFIKKFDIE